MLKTNIIPCNTEKVLMHTPTDQNFSQLPRRFWGKKSNIYFTIGILTGMLMIIVCSMLCICVLHYWGMEAAIAEFWSKSQLGHCQMLSLLKSETDTAMFHEKTKKFLNF